MQLAGRDDEIHILEKQLTLTESSFVAMYGRRRIGKTYLIRQVYAKQIIFDCSGLHEKNTTQQLENFYLTINSIFKRNEKNAMPTTWLQAFNQLKQYISSIKNDKKKVIFLDEISWYDTPKSGFKAALDNFWNQFAVKRNDMVLVICGSAASWIINKIINDKGGLHNRITCTIALQPFTLKETAAYFKLKKIELVPTDIIKLYMATGGIPYYIKDIENGQSVDQIIQQVFFAKNATLKNEFQNLYAALFKNSKDHVVIIKALNTKNKGLTRTEIIKATKLPSGGGLTTTLQELIHCGFIMQIQPINKNKEDVLYRLIDEYSIFYFKFIENRATATKWIEISTEPMYKIWCGFAFENICLKHIDNIKNAIGISGVNTNAFSWQINNVTNKLGAQIDLIIDRKDNCINLCEAKFYNAMFETTKQIALQLQNKKAQFKLHTKTKKNIFITLITLDGAITNKYYKSVVANQITATNFFK
jgi:uncharacterized protein